MQGLIGSFSTRSTPPMTSCFLYPRCRPCAEVARRQWRVRHITNRYGSSACSISDFRSLLIPFVQNADEAARAVAATRYPPTGIRGVAAYQRNNKYGRVTDYFDFIDDAIAVVAQIETASAMQNLKAIALTPGIDAIFVGPGDLAASLGHLGRPMAAQVQDAIRQIGKEAKELGKPAGIVAGSPADVERYLEWGFSFYTVSSDAAVFRNGLELIVRTLPGLRSHQGIVA